MNYLNPDLIPTKRNFLITKKNLVMAEKGHELLDKKYKVLLREFLVIKNESIQLRNQLQQTMAQGIKLLTFAQMEIGEKNLVKISKQIPFDTLQITYKNTMGASIPNIIITHNINNIIGYNLNEGTATLDEAFLVWNDIKNLIQKLVEIETTAEQINKILKKARKRAAALKNITIPAYEKRIKYIAEQLEERERDEIARVRVARDM